MARKSGNISILQFSEQGMTRLRARRGAQGVDVLSFDRERGAWSAEDGSLRNALREFVARLGVHDDDVYTILPRHSITTRIIDLPSDSPEEITSMVRFSAEEYVPFSADELLIDECVLHKTPGGESRVLAAFAHRDVVNGHMEMLQAAGIVPERVFLSTACLASAAAAAPPGGPGEFALVNLALGGIEGVIVDAEGRLVYGRGVAASRDWCQAGESAAEGLEELAVETRATLGAYRRESLDGIGAERVFLCSDLADVGEAVAHVEAETGKPCTSAEFALAVVRSGREHLDVQPLAALGAALTAQGRGKYVIDLLPESVTEVREMRAVRKRLLQAAGLVVLLLAGVAALFYQEVRQRENYLKRLEERMAAMAGQAEGIREKRDQLSILRREVRPLGSVLQYLAQVCTAAPEEGLNILEFRFQHNDGIDIRGRAVSLDVINAFGQSLREVGRDSTLRHFVNATRKYENANIPERDKMLWEYQYLIPFKTEEDGNETVAATR